MSDKRLMPYPLRMTAELRKLVEMASTQSGRSTNAEINARLTASFMEQQPDLSDAELERIAMRVALSSADVERIAVRVVQLLQSQ